MKPRHNKLHSKVLFRWLRRLAPNVPSLLLVTIYVLGGVALEEIATVFETAEKITTWDPSSSLHLVLLLGFGLRYTPALVLVPLLDNLVVRPSNIGLFYLLLCCLWIILGYGTASALLLHKLHIDPRLHRFRDVFWFAIVTFVVSFFVSVSIVTTLAAAGLFSWSEWGSHLLHDWAGEATGIVMLAPLLLIMLRAVPWSGSHVALGRLITPINLTWPRSRQALEWGAEVLAVVFVTWIAYVIPSGKHLNYTYFVFLPLIWIAVQHGFERAALAVLLINISVVSVVHIKLGDADPLALQFGLMTVSYTGLLLGAVVSERQQVQEQLLYDAYHDNLTGLHNRAGFMDKLEQAAMRTNQDKACFFAVFFLDLDRFKVVNDSLGHTFGDQLLKAIAERLQEYLQSKDTVARFGGDEFTILLEDIQGVREITRVAQRIIKDLAQSINVDRQEIFITVSIGIAISSTGYEQPEDLLRNAGIAMYRAKTQGRARYAVFDSAMHDDIIRLSQLENELRQAVEGIENTQTQFQLHYQPIISLTSGKITGFEALIRWQHPSQGLVPPIKFIPLAEETGLIIPISRWVLREACHQLHTWQAILNTSLTMSVNLSGKQFLQPDLVEQIDQILRETGLNAGSLKLEITESVVMENSQEVCVMLERIKALGVQLSIDDFGTGYSSLSRLHNFPVNTLKIDRSFVSQIGINGENSEIIQAIVMLAQHLAMSITAEGVETAEQLAKLRMLKCEEGQGYFFARPLTSQAAEELLATIPHW